MTQGYSPGTRFRLTALAVALLCWESQAWAAPQDVTTFDLQALQALGVDPKMAEMFREAPRFLPGETPVVLTVNGSARGRVTARFDAQGKLCADSAFLKQAGLQLPSGFSSDACADLKQAWPRSELHLDPGEARVDIVVPPEAVASPGAESGNWSHGGTAGLLNYDAQYMGSAGGPSGVSFSQLGTEAGFNAGDWIFRSRQTMTRFDGQDDVQHQAAYAQRTFPGVKKVLQAGQVSLSNSMFGAGQVLGFQVFPEAALAGNRGGPGIVEGIADTQSVVEVRQSGVLVYSTTVPAGPYRLQGLNLLNVRSDLEVSVTGSNGQKRQFTVPASAFLVNGNAVAPGLSFGAGRLDQQGSNESPVMATLATGWLLSPSTAVNAGFLASSPYRAGALSLDTQPFNATQFTLQATAAQDTRHDSRGVSLTAGASYQLTERTSLALNASEQSYGFRELSDALLKDTQEEIRDRARRQFGGSVGWSVAELGSLNLSWARSTTFSGDNRDYLSAGWSRQFGRTYVGVSAEHSTGSRYSPAENRVYLSLNVPFGSRSLSSYVSNSGGSTRGGIRYSDRSSQDRGWSLSSEKDFRTQRSSGTGSFDMVTPVSQLSGSLTHDSDNRTSWSGRASGAVVAHAGGVTLSSYRVGDTFGIARVGEEGGVRLDTPAGPAWTDGRGYAVLPSLSSFRRSAIQVDTRSLAKNVDIANAWQETEAARGSVSHVAFDVVRTRRVLAEVRDTRGNPLPHGAAIFADNGDFVTVVGDKGSVFVPDAAPGMKMTVQSSGQSLCSFTLALPEKARESGLYETAAAQCR